MKPYRFLVQHGLTIPAMTLACQRFFARRAVGRQLRVGGRPHGLPGRLVVSLTSYPPRFPTLKLTLASLLQQTVRPDAIVLWIAREDMAQIPHDIADMPDVTIRECENIRSYKKLVFTLREWPDAWIVTVDDDLYLRPKWLQRMVEGAEAGVAVAHRAHRVRWRDGQIVPYLEWDHEVTGPEEISDDLFATTGSGVLFPPNSLDPMATDIETALDVCPTGDDLWFGCALQRAGTRIKKLGGRFPLVSWPESQAESLWEDHNLQKNDEMVARLAARYGFFSNPSGQR